MQIIDPSGIVEIRNALLDIHREGVTILITGYIFSVLSNVAMYYGFLSKGCMLSKCNPYLGITVNTVQRMTELMRNKLHRSKFELVNDNHTV